MSSLHPTGVEILDYVLGGIAPGLPCVLAGPSGAGRTVLCIQLAQAALESGRVVIFICNEPVPFFLQQAATLGFDLESSLRTGQLVLLELDVAISSSVRSQGMESFVRAEEPIASTLIIDPFTALTPDIRDEASLRRLAREFTSAASPMDIVLTVESERLALQQGLERALSQVCGAFLRLHRNDSGQRTLTVEKTRSGVGFADRVDFRIGDGGTSPRLPAPEVEMTPAPESTPRLVISERVTRPGDRIGPLVLGATDTLANPSEVRGSSEGDRKAGLLVFARALESLKLFNEATIARKLREWNVDQGGRRDQRRNRQGNRSPLTGPYLLDDLENKE